MYCSIDRFEVAGRRFPFGGRCSLYENVWKRKSRTAAAPDLVEQRAELLFGRSNGHARRVAGHAGGMERPAGERVPAIRSSLPCPRVGIPRALTTHSLFPLYSTFFSRLGMDVVLSDVDTDGDLKSYSGFCFPAQIAHGAVLDLARQGVELVFLPHVVRMPQANPCRDSYLCPITQAGPYFLAKAFPEVRFLSPQFDFTNGYETSSALVEMAVRELGVDREWASQAWAAAVEAQNEAERALRELGRTSARTSRGRRPTGHSARRPQLQRLHARGVAIGGKEALQHGNSRPFPPTAWCRSAKDRRPGTSPTRS